MAAVEHPLTRDEIATELADVRAQLEQIESDNAGVRFTDQIRENWNELNTRRDELVTLDAELETRARRIEEIAGENRSVERIDAPQIRRPGAVTGDDIYDLSTIRSSWDDPAREASDLRDRAMRAIDTARFPYSRRGPTPEDQQTHLGWLADNVYGSPAALNRHILATGSPAYRRAFESYLSGGVQATREIEVLTRAASLATGSGGYAVPYVLDPTVIQTGSGAINPYRTISSVTQITVDEWRGVSSTGITAAFQAEAAATTDNTPTLAGPTVSTEMARALVPFSIEIGMDWSGFASEMSQMFSDSKDVLEATKFATGTGTNEPFGVITGATTVFTASNTNSLVIADIYSVHNALGPRFRHNASWTLNNATADAVRKIDTAGGAGLWVDNLTLRSAAVPNSFTDGRMGADLLGKPVYEASGQSGTFTTGQLIGVFGDFQLFKIVDRVGMTVETIPHIFGSAQGNLPTGQRGLFAYWRVGSKVIDANAFRVLKLA